MGNFKELGGGPSNGEIILKWGVWYLFADYGQGMNPLKLDILWNEEHQNTELQNTDRKTPAEQWNNKILSRQHNKMQNNKVILAGRIFMQ